MKKGTTIVRGLLCAAFITSTAVLSAQKAKGNYTATFEDGTKIDWALYKDKPDEMFTKHITVMGLMNETGQTNEISYSSINPGRFTYRGAVFAGIRSGFNGLAVGGTWYFVNGGKIKDQSVTVRSHSSGNVTTKYQIKVPIERGKYFGVNAEFGFNRMQFPGNAEYEFNTGHYDLEKISYGVVAIGVGYNSLRGVQVKVKESEGGIIGGSRLFTAVANLLFFPGTSVEAIAMDSLAMTHPLEAGDVMTSKIGYRVYVQFQPTFLYHKRSGNAPTGALGATMRLGVVKAPFINTYGFGLVDGGALLTPLVGIGLFYTFY